MRALLDSYNNFDLSSPFITLELIIWPIFIGIVIASLAAVYNKRVIGSVVRALIKAGANSPDSAKTLAEVGCERNLFVKMTLRHDTGVLSKFVRPVIDNAEKACDRGDCSASDANDVKKKLTFLQWVRKFFTGEPYPAPTVPVSTARFYIPENLTDRAQIRYEKKGTDLFTVIVTIIVFFVLALLAIKYIPQLITLLDDTITVFKEI